MQHIVEPIDASNQAQMVEFLRQHENTSLFLLGNFENYGGKLSNAPYSGNFKLLRSEDRISAVFCLTRKGSLLIEATIKDPIFELVLRACKEEPMPINGVVGNWDFCQAFWQFLKNKKGILQETFAAKEILYTVELSHVFPPSQSHVRLLKESDYSQWKPLRLAYIKEEGFPIGLSDSQIFDVYRDKVEKKIIWGFFLDGQLVSIADLNALALDLGQVGGVYTVPSLRGNGYSKAVMQQILADAKKLHSLRKLIIFTGEKNVPAQKLYTSLKVQPVGYFALFFGS